MTRTPAYVARDGMVIGVSSLVTEGDRLTVEQAVEKAAGFLRMASETGSDALAHHGMVLAGDLIAAVRVAKAMPDRLAA